MMSTPPPLFEDKSNPSAGRLVIGLILAVAAVVAALVAFYSDHHWTVRFAVMGIAAVLGLLGLLFTLISGRRIGGGRWVKGLTVVVSVLAILASLGLFAGDFGALIVRLRSVLSRSVSAHRNPSGTQLGVEAGTPIEVKGEALTLEQVRKFYDAWAEQNLVAIYNAEPSDAVRLLLRGTVNRAVGVPNSTGSDQMIAWADQAMAGREPQPILLLAVSRLPGDREQRRKQLEDAIAGLSGKKGAEAAIFLAQLDLWAAGSKQERAANVQPVLTALKMALSARKLSDADYWTWQALLDADKGETLFEVYGDKVLATLDAIPNLEPWFKHRFRGKYAKELAWKVRGTGWASEVSKSGWQGFEAQLEKARTELTKSWELNPHHPAAATTMIGVSMGSSDDPVHEMRQWFDRAVTARFDYLPAYESLRWGLRPRWHGSEAAMLAFGRECLQTRRFDTMVPWEFVHTLRDMASEWDEPEALYPEVPRWDEVKSVIEGYLAEEKRPGTLLAYQTQGVILAWLCKRPEECRRYLAAAKYQLDEDVADDWGINLEAWLPEVTASTGPAALLYRRGADEEERDDFAASEKTFTEALALPDLDAASRGYLEQRKAAAAGLAQLAAGTWKPLMPENDFTGWTPVFGSPTREANGSVEAKSSLMLRRDTPVGPIFEVRGELELPDASDVLGGFAWGDPTASGDDWMSVMLRRSERSGTSVVLARRFADDRYVKRPRFGERARFHLRIANSHLTLRVDDQLVLDRRVDLPATLAPESGLALIAPIRDDSCIVRWHSLELRTPAQK